MITSVDILAIGAHPDDIELSCAGTLAKEISKGRSVGLLDLTQGELGTRGSAELRLKEAEASREILGAKFRVNLGFKDGFFKDDEAHQIEIIKVIRQAKPKVVFANALADRHPDHGKAGRLISTACFLAGLVKIETEGLEPHRPELVLHYNQDRLMRPDICVDISDFMEIKMNAIMAFGSQFFDPNSTEPETPISGEGFLEAVKSRGIEFGRPIGAKYAEGFQCERYLGVDSVLDLK